ncbi:hypothetical protein [Aliikangiella maris]|uniref:Cation diffusion facilitator family transporter n=2 Tax=Aliikangiella maris TaxID=3162458 RepID=A0ABV3MN28_9GAMM
MTQKKLRFSGQVLQALALNNPCQSSRKSMELFKNTNFFQRINVAATFLIVAALVKGIVDGLKGYADSNSVLKYFSANLDISILAVFVLFFKIKMMIDDHHHFSEENQGTSGYRWAGFFLAFVVWVFIALSGYFIHNAIRSAELLSLSLLLSIGWIAIHLKEITKKTPVSTDAVIAQIRQKWVLLNVAYIVCLVSYIGWLEPIVKSGEIILLWLKP